MTQVKFPGHRINADGIQPTQEKIQAVLDAPEPKSKTQLQSILGWLAFYDQFLENRAEIARDPYALLKQKTQWTYREALTVFLSRM